MNTANGDRNLLFGILALQMDFIARDALVRAMNAWVLDKLKPLSQILVEQGALSASRRALLEPLVQEHIQQHGDDPGKSLAAVSSVGSAREELKRIADPDVQASLVNLPTSDPNLTKYPSAGENSAVGRRFLILRPHAEGGLGKVSVALDGELNREVALKEIHEQYADHTESRSRFLLEAEITGGLEHPSIVPVYGLGQYEDGRPFYAMRFIRGDSLKEAIERFHRTKGPINAGKRALELRQLLGRFNDVCDAIAYAHSRGVLHRDLKPGNIMLGKYGETLVVDWGLAKPAGAAANKADDAESPLQPSSADGSAPTQMGSAIGTPQFMPPEQAAGRLDQMGPASDVYSLGATLYCLLTGKPPFTDRDVGVVLQKVQRGDFPRPRQVQRDIPPALEAICLKAMALRPADRYPTARALAGDIEKWLADEPVSVYREGWTERTLRWARRRPSAAAFLGLFVAALLLGTAVSTYFAIESNANYEDARQREQDANNQRERVGKANTQLEDQKLQLVKTNKQLDDQKSQLVKTNEQLEDQKSQLEGTNEQLKRQKSQLAKTNEQLEEQRSAAVREKRLAVEAKGLAEESSRVARAHEFAARALPFMEGDRDRQTALAWAIAAVRAHNPPLDDALTVLYGASQANQLIAEFPRHGDLSPTSWVWSPNGEQFATEDSSQTICIWDRNGKVVATLAKSTAPQFVVRRFPRETENNLSWSPDSESILVSGADAPVRLYNRKGALLATIPVQRKRPCSCLWNPTGDVVALWQIGDPDVALWNNKQHKTTNLKGRTQPIANAEWLDDGSLLLTAEGGLLPREQPAAKPNAPSIRLWDREGNLRSTIQNPDEPIIQGGWIPGQPEVWTIDGKGIVRLWDLDAKQLAAFGGSDSKPPKDSPTAGLDIPTRVSWNPKGTSVLIYGRNQLRLWNTKGTAISPTLAEETTNLTVAWSPDGHRFVTVLAFNSDVVQLYDSTGRLLANLGGDKPSSERQFFERTVHGAPVHHVLWNPNGSRLVTVSFDKSWVWDADGSPLFSLGTSQQPVSSLEWSPDGKLMAVGVQGEGESSLRIIDASNHYVGMVMGPKYAGDGSLLWSPDSSRLATAGRDETVQLWEPIRRPSGVLRGLASETHFLEWQPGGNLLTTACAEGGTRCKLAFWEAKKQRAIAPSGYELPIVGMGWNPNGRVLGVLERRKKKNRMDDPLGTLRIVDTSGETLRSISECDWFDWSPDGRTLAIALSDGTLGLRDDLGEPRKDASEQAAAEVIPGGKGIVVDMQWNPKGTVLAIMSFIGNRGVIAYELTHDSPPWVISLWDGAGKNLGKLNHPFSSSTQIIWSPDSDLVVTAGEDGAQVWTRQGELHASIPSQRPVRHCVWNNDSKLIAIGYMPNKPESPGQSVKPENVELWDREGNLRARLSGHNGGVTAINWHPHRSLIATASHDGKIRLWNAQGQLLSTMEGHEGLVDQLTWNPSGTMLASYGTDRTVRLWTADGSPVITLSGPVWSLFPMAFVTRGETLAYSLVRRADSFLAWSPDGRQLVAARGGSDVEQWEVDFLEVYQQALRKLVRQSTGVSAEIARPVWDPEKEEQWLGFPTITRKEEKESTKQERTKP